MLQIALDHFLRHLPHRCTEIPSCQKMLSPVPLPYVGKFLKQLARRPPFEPPHDLTRRQRRGAAHHDMHVILAYHSLDDPDLERFAGLPHQTPYPLPDLSRQHFVPLLCHPYKMVFDLKDGMTPIPIFHPAHPFRCRKRCRQLKEAFLLMPQRREAFLLMPQRRDAFRTDSPEANPSRYKNQRSLWWSPTNGVFASALNVLLNP